MARWNMPALSEIRTPSYAPSARLQSISSGDGNSAENHFPISPTEYDRKLFPPSVNAACKAAEQGEEAARCLDQGLPAERLYYGDSGDSEEEETDDSSDSESDMEEDLSGEEESDSEAEQKRCAERRLLRKRKGAPKGYSYKTQHKWMARAFSECGIKTSAVTHTGRKAGALHMEMMGLGIESIRRHGKLCKSEALNKM